MKKTKRNVALSILLLLLFCSGCSYGVEKHTNSSVKYETDVEQNQMKEDVHWEEKAIEEVQQEEEIEKVTEKTNEEIIQEVKEVTEAVDFTVCIDPGHYGGANLFQFSDGSSYCEGDVTLQIALKLKEILENNYGIHAYLTRETKDINIQGYVNSDLDHRHISLRGKASQGSDLFLSVHTNANNDMANGYDTLFQPIAINKPLIILNTTGCADEKTVKIANCVGKNLVNVLCEHNLSTKTEFHEAADSSEIIEWTDSYNDSLESPGTICKRTDADGDYYGVLRGASDVEVPGMIIEHVFHTVPEVRKEMEITELVTELAEADADGIAEGLGIPVEEH